MNGISIEVSTFHTNTGDFSSSNSQVTELVDVGNGDVSDNKTLHHTGSNPVLTTGFNSGLTYSECSKVETKITKQYMST
jgi:hypothetical protein